MRMSLLLSKQRARADKKNKRRADPLTCQSRSETLNGDKRQPVSLVAWLSLLQSQA